MRILVIGESADIMDILGKAMALFGFTAERVGYNKEMVRGLLKSQVYELVVLIEKVSVEESEAFVRILETAVWWKHFQGQCMVIQTCQDYDLSRAEHYKTYVHQGKLAVLPRKDLELALKNYFVKTYSQKVPFNPIEVEDRTGFPVLVVDDSILARMHVAVPLRNAHFKVFEADNGVDAYALFEEVQPVAVITDIVMPILGGLELCRRIKQKNPYTEVIVLSSLSHEETIDLAYDIGVDDFMTKPVSSERLVKKMTSVVDGVLEKRQHKILIVDDDAFVREKLRREFDLNSMEVILATDGIEGFSKAVMHQPSIIISDVEMPGMNGYELLEAIQSAKILEHSTLILMSGTFTKNQVKRRVSLEGIQFFSKSSEMDKMVPLVDQLIQMKSNDARKANAMFLEGIRALVYALEARDVYTSGHSERVTEYALIIGMQMGLNAAQLKTLEIAAFLHDLGKIGVRDDVLNKPGKLTADEYAVIQEHCWTGARILSTIDSLSRVAEIMLSHHEHYDGKGYPRGIKGNHIPIESRIISVADVYDAVTSSRPYRDWSASHQEAIDMIKGLSGTQLCPVCVKAFVDAWFKEM